jgi:hypothetical protein
LVSEFKAEWVTEKEVNLGCGRNQKNEAKVGWFVYNPKFGYKVELGFSARDIGTVVVGNEM